MRAGLFLNSTGDPGGMTLRYSVIPLLEASFCVTHSLRTLWLLFSDENYQKINSHRNGGIYFLVTPAGFEPAIFWMRTKYPGPLDDGAPSWPRHDGYHVRTVLSCTILPYLLRSVQIGGLHSTP
jgi:hypothetical protein